MKYCFALCLRFFVPAVLLAVGTAQADLTELQNANHNFDDPGGGWTSTANSYGSIQSNETRGWNASGATGREANMGQKFMRVFGTGDVGQFVVLNQQSKHQILSILAFKRSTNGQAPGWTGFGITYYDSSWNELDKVLQEIDVSTGSNRGYGDGMKEYSLALNVPSNAANAYIWVWNATAGTEIFLDKFELVNYFTETNFIFNPNVSPGDQYTAIEPAGRNLVLNGDFATGYGNEEFWNTGETSNTIYYDPNRGKLHVGGPFDANIISQQINDIEPGKNYTLTADYLRPIDGGSVGDGPPWAGIGVDFYDANSNRISKPFVALNDTQATAETHQGRVDFTVPSNTATTYVWMWIAGGSPPQDIPILLDRVLIREQAFSEIRLESSTYSVSESGGSVSVRVVRENGSDGVATVEYDTINDTAIAGVDYQSRSGTITWANGESGVKTVNIPITNDNTIEPNKLFRFTIDNPTGQVTLLAPRTATITIDDDDSVLGQGDGLLAEYFNNADLTNRQLVRTDATLNFDWGSGSPNPAIGSNTFSARWTGQIEPRFSETYTFSTLSDDGIRLWVNDQLIINEWNDHGATTHTGTVSLTAGVLYDIRVEYYENSGGAVAALRWSSNSQSNEIVPTSQLYAADAPPQSVDNLVTQTVIAGLSQPTSIDWTPDGQTMFITFKDGRVRVLRNGALQSQLFIDLRPVVNGTRDRGLLDIAVHPNFPTQPYVYLLYTYDPPEVFNNTGLAGPEGQGNRAGRLMRVTADANNAYRTAVPGSEVILLGNNSTWQNFNGFANSTNDFDEPPAGINANGTNIQDFIASDSESHTVGSLVFGNDGNLFVSIGDGTSYNAVDDRTVRVQDIDNLSGKILRINPLNGRGLSSNPFYNGNNNANRSKVYQLGVRNPFRMAIDRTSGRLFIGDVGWTRWEEVNSGGPGANFGWPYYEGGDNANLRTGGYENLPEAQAFYAAGTAVTPPVRGLNHNDTGINAIVLGDVYTGTAYPSRYVGDLFFNDLGQGIVRNLSFNASGQVTASDTFATGARNVVKIRQGPDGNLYFVDLDGNFVGRWVFE